MSSRVAIAEVSTCASDFGGALGYHYYIFLIQENIPQDNLQHII
jgi:hypothetical protein